MIIAYQLFLICCRWSTKYVFGYPDISLLSNPDNRYKYPKLTEKEYLRQQRQTEEGVTNELNRFKRQEETERSFDDI